MEWKELNITWGGLWRIFFMLIFTVVLFVSFDVLIALFLAIIISASLDPLVSWLEKKKVPRILGTLAIYIIGIFVLAVIVYAFIPMALSELTNFLASFSEKINEQELKFLNLAERLENIGANLERITNVLISNGTSFFDIASKFFGGIALVVSVFVLSFYLTVGKDGVEQFLITILPTAYENRAIELYTRVRNKISKWFRGQLLLSLVIGFTVSLGLWLLGVKYSLVLGLLAGILELVPYVGPIFSGALAIMVASTESLTLALYVFLLFVVIQQLENHVLVPSVMSLTTNLNPVVILISLLMGAKIFGAVGLILAVPAAVLLQEIVEDWSGSKKRKNAAPSA